MRILVVSHDFPPDPAPQALRVGKLCRHLQTCGHSVEVICAAGLSDSIGAEHWQGVAVQRVWPGGVDACLRRLRSLRTKRGPVQRQRASASASAVAANASGLNWKGRSVARLRALVDYFVFPDARSLWIRHALVAGRERLDRGGIDLIVGAHEPAAGVRVAATLAEQYKLPWIAELGDPILAAYTAPRWRRRAFKLEQQVFQTADAVVLTSSVTQEQLEGRHGNARHVEVITQGFDAAEELPRRQPLAGAALQLIYTGRFYTFRDPTPLMQAVEQVEGVELVIASPALPEALGRQVQHNAGKFKYVGMLGHAEATALQARADLLVSIGNAGMSQVPGKVLEYMGAGRPLLHISPDDGDAAAAIIRAENCGYVVPADVGAIAELLHDLVQRKQRGTLAEGLTVGAEHFQHYRWDNLGKRFATLCEKVVAHSSLPADH